MSIVHVEQRAEGFICDREAIAIWLGRSTETIRKHCVVVDRTRSGRPLYNFDHCLYTLDQVPERRGARTPR